MRTLLAGLVASVALVGATAEPARACSCAPPDPRALLGQVDGAFVGRLEGRRDAGAGRAVFTFRVERAVKGRLGERVEVESASNGAACGLETQVGARIGLFLERDGSRWTSSLCWQVDPEDLLAATQPLPPPTGRGAATLLVGGRFGPARLMALDRLGRTLAYGRGRGTVLQLAGCPGGRRTLEAVQLDSGPVVAVRELPGLRVVRQRRVASPPGTFVAALRCETPDGRRLLLFHASADPPRGARLDRLSGARTTVLWRGAATGATLTERTALVTAGVRGAQLLAVDLASRRVRTVGRIPPPFGPLVADRAATELAGVVSLDGSRRHIARIRLRPFAVVTRPLVEVGEVAWVSDRRLALFSGVDGRARVYTSALRVASSFGWSAYRSALAGTTAWGVGSSGRLYRAALPAGPERVVRRLPGPNVSAIVAVP